MRFSETGALKIGRTLIISDIHLGILGFPDFSLLDRILDAYFKSGAERLVINGDLKHRLGRSELKSVERFIEEIEDQVSELVLVRGNHDGLLDEVHEVMDCFSEGKVTILHGHREYCDVWGSKVLVVAHAHPAVLIPDVVGGIKERAWMVHEGEGFRCIVMPAFNEMCSSTAVNLEKPPGFVFDRLWEFEVFTVTGYYYGRVRF
ncbi:putative phosphoesterase [Geoglobus ahangari]|uniref:Putative phosphoesterase n=1 Tax=Geoglobus ahangari TaxID=113653 RepID=A0A0F7IDP3_9EURY|nr:metallophosphoesterase [Geoglobus ahangari]AKG90723.1 putative phosphoesterase [Geoglobus ahangari]